jgi:sortase A
VTLTQTALDREMLLVPVPTTGAGPRPLPCAPEGGPGTGESDESGGPVRDPADVSPLVAVVRPALIVVAVLAFGLVLQLTVVSSLAHRSAQASLYNQLRTELALGTAPLGPVDPQGHAIAPGTPIALITIPSIGVKQVVVEGTTSPALAKGPGHLRSTVFPGGSGTSVIFGRAAAYGGPFGRIPGLQKGDRVTVVTGVGTSVFRVVDVRHAGGKVKVAPAGTSRLTLGTASGSVYVPSGVTYVDAAKVGKPLAAQSPLVTAVLPSERPFGIDTSTLWALLLWLEAFALVLAGAVWTWRRQGHAQAWIVFTAPFLLVWMFIADQITRILPNLL